MRLFHLSPAAHPPKKFVLGRGIVPGIDHGNAIQGNLLNTLKAKTPRSFRQISPMGLSGLGDGRTSVVIFGGGERRVARNTTIYLILKSRTLGWSTEVSRPFKQGLVGAHAWCIFSPRCPGNPVHSFTPFLYRVPYLWRRFALQSSKTWCHLCVLEFRMMMLFNDLHPLKGQYPILATDFGMEMLFKEVQPWKAASPISVTELEMVMLSKEVQPAKALVPIWVTQSGMVMLSKEVQPAKALSQMHVTQSGMVMLSNEVQPAKAASPISLTESGMVMLSNEVQPAKALLPIWVTRWGMVMLSKEVQPSKALLRIWGTQLGMVMLSKEVQPAKALSKMHVTQSGMVMLSNEVQPAKALIPIWVTESGMVMLSKEVQPAKALVPIWVTQSGMVMLSKEVQRSKAASPISLTESGRVMLSNEVQPAKAASPISLTESGMVMLSNEVQPAKAASPISLTESGMVMLSKEAQPAKPLFPIWVTQSGMVMLSNEVQPAKAASPISVTESGMVTFTTWLQSTKAPSQTLVTASGILTWQNSSVWTSCCVAASTSFRLNTAVTSGSACNPDSFSVWASFSKPESFNTSTFRIFCSTGSWQNFSPIIHFSCCTVSIFVTSRVKASPFKMFTVNSWAMAASMDVLGKMEQNKIHQNPSKHLWRVTVKPSIWRSLPVANIDLQLGCLQPQLKYRCWVCRQLGTLLHSLCKFVKKTITKAKLLGRKFPTFQTGFLGSLSTSMNMTCCCSVASIVSTLHPVGLEPGG